MTIDPKVKVTIGQIICSKKMKSQELDCMSIQANGGHFITDLDVANASNSNDVMYKTIVSQKHDFYELLFVQNYICKIIDNKLCARFQFYN